MCEFFSAIATRDGRVLFCEHDSHEEIITRAQLPDDDAYLRHWVRVEVRPVDDGWGRCRVDETSIPAWWTEDEPAWVGRVLAVADRVRPAWAAYEETMRPAWAAYEEVERPARAAYVAAISTLEGYMPCDQP